MTQPTDAALAKARAFYPCKYAVPDQQLPCTEHTQRHWETRRWCNACERREHLASILDEFAREAVSRAADQFMDYTKVVTREYHNEARAKAVAAERERCAAICDHFDDWRTIAREFPEQKFGAPTEAEWMAGTLAARIRALGSEKR